MSPQNMPLCHEDNLELKETLEKADTRKVICCLPIYVKAEHKFLKVSPLLSLPQDQS